MEIVKNMKSIVDQQLNLTSAQIDIEKHKIVNDANFTYKDLQLYKDTGTTLEKYNNAMGKI